MNWIRKFKGIMLTILHENQKFDQSAQNILEAKRKTVSACCSIASGRLLKIFEIIGAVYNVNVGVTMFLVTVILRKPSALCLY